MRYYSKTPDDPDTWGAVGSAGVRFARPAPVHTLTKAARQARKAVRDFAAERNAQRRESIGLPPINARGKRELAERIDPATLTGSPKTTAARLSLAGAKVAATRARSGAALSVWAIMPNGQRIRALYERGAAGTMLSRGAIVDGDGDYLIGAALEAVGAPPLPKPEPKRKAKR